MSAVIDLLRDAVFPYRLYIGTLFLQSTPVALFLKKTYIGNNDPGDAVSLFPIPLVAYPAPGGS